MNVFLAASSDSGDDRQLMRQIRRVVVRERRRERSNPRYVALGDEFSTEPSSEHALDRAVRLGEHESYTRHFVESVRAALPPHATDRDVIAIYVASRLLGPGRWARVFGDAHGTRVSSAIVDAVDAYQRTFETPTAGEWNELCAHVSKYLRERLAVSGKPPIAAQKFVGKLLPDFKHFERSDTRAFKVAAFVYATSISPAPYVQKAKVPLVESLLEGGGDAASKRKILAVVSRLPRNDRAADKLVRFMILSMFEDGPRSKR